MEPENLYSILGLSEKSNPEEIKNSYRKLALKYHPDKQQGTESDQLDENRMKSINYAAKILIDPSERFRYNSSLLGKYLRFIPNV
ncbi:DnaJ domain containing protein 6 [Sarcoptes scabiei]|uniref:DnaJ domain containing protein 6 n=1 Tax=Sarcoptes scabiei TaxID=52283 RepID=A0A132AK09_SARSC|nr:DnaJ domain containing protein 6 [Sarcoptes scabiei]